MTRRFLEETVEDQAAEIDLLQDSSSVSSFVRALLFNITCVL